MNRFFKYTKILLIAILCFSLSLLFAACGEPGEKGDKGDKGDTGAAGVGIVSIAKDSTVGNVDIYKITMSNGNTSTFTVTNGINGTNGSNGQNGQDGQNGQNGADGVSVTNAQIVNGELVLSFSEGNPINLGKVVGDNGKDGQNGTDGKDGQDGADGKDGKDGVGIKGIVLSPAGELTITLTNDTPINLGYIKGQKGDDGLNGQDGVSVTGASINSDGELILSFSKGDPINLGVVVGKDGAGLENPCDHNYDEGIDLIKNCEQHVVVKTCSLCGDDDVVYDNTPHHDYVTKTDTYEHWQECSVCNAKTDGIAHTITTENECQDCDYTCKPLAGMEFALSDDGTFYSLVNTAKNQAKYEIPRYYKGKPVKKIGGNVFFEDYFIEEINIPEGITGMAYIDSYGAAQKISFPKSFEGFDLLPEEYLWSDFNNGLFDLNYVDFRDNEHIEDILFNYYEEDGYTFNYGLLLDVDTECCISEDNANYVVKDDMLLTKDGKTLLLYMPATATNSAVTIPDGVETIKGWAFSCKKNIKSVYMPDSVTTVEEGIFNSCEDLKKVRLSANLQKISQMMFLGCKNLRMVENINQVEIIEDWAFEGCENLHKLANADSLQKIGYGAFEGCSGLESVTFGENSQLASIGAWSFSGCSNLNSVTFGENSQLETIGENAFQDCTNLVSVVIPSSITSIGLHAFEECSSLISVYITDIAAWCNISFDSTESNPINEGAELYLNGEKVTDLAIPTGVKQIKDFVFYNCDSITSVTIPGSVTSIGEYAFDNCDNLANVTFGKNSQLASIGRGAISGCNNLTSIVIPSSVTSIGYYAISFCDNLTIYCEATSQPSGWAYNWNNNNRPVYWYSETQPITTGNYWHYVDGVVTKWFESESSSAPNASGEAC